VFPLTNLKKNCTIWSCLPLLTEFSNWNIFRELALSCSITYSLAQLERLIWYVEINDMIVRIRDCFCLFFLKKAQFLRQETDEHYCFNSFSFNESCFVYLWKIAHSPRQDSNLPVRQFFSVQLAYIASKNFCTPRSSGKLFFDGSTPLLFLTYHKSFS
jgi:hypothetical protein